jgi:hypothetical protein
MPQARRTGPPTSNRGGEHPVVEYTGFQAYNTSVSTVSTHTQYPTMKLIASYNRWKDIELTNGVWTWPSGLSTSISDAHSGGYKISLRISCGSDSPISSASSDKTPGWMASFVPYLRTLRNETNPRSAYDGEVLVPIPWDATHLTYYTRFMQAAAAYLDGPCPADSSHARKEHIYMFVAGMPTEFGTEMSIGYGQIAVTWRESTAGAPPKLATAWTAASPANGATFTLTGTVSSIPQPAAGQYVLLKVGGAVGDDAAAAPYPSGTELVLCSAFNRTTKVATIAANGRGWSGTTAQSHNTSTTGSVFYADDSTTSGNLAAPITWNGLTGIFDHQMLNRDQWATLGFTEAQYRVKMGDAWIDSINAQLTAAPSVKCGFAGSSVFRDNFVQANRVLDTLYATKNYAEKLVCHTTHLLVDANGTPGNRTYAQADPNGAAWMQVAASYNHLCGFQTGGLSVLANGQAFIDACEDGIATYPTRFIESNANSRFTGTIYNTIAVGGWPGGSVTMQQYCLSSAANLQARIPAS